MADHAVAHFHNTAGRSEIAVGLREFMCIGALPPFDHPHVFIDMGGGSDAICPYCSTRFVHDEALHGAAGPRDCLWTTDSVPA